MKTRLAVLVSLGCVVALTAWFVQAPNAAQPGKASDKLQETLKKGLDFLVKHQHKDGHWEGDDGKHPVAMTGLVGLALFMECARGQFSESRDRNERSIFLAETKRAVDWLIDRSEARKDGLIFSGHATETDRYMEGHGLATILLAGFARDERDKKVRAKLGEVLTRAVNYIVKAQSGQGGWYHTSRVEGHDFDAASVTVIQIQALQAASNAGISVPSVVIEDGQRYLKQALAKHQADKSTSTKRWTETTGALACYFNETPRLLPADEPTRKWLDDCEAAIPRGAELKFGRDELMHFYYAQALFVRSEFAGTTWSGYCTSVLDRLRENQDRDGGWPAAAGLGVGRVYATALWCTVLQLDRCCYPSTRFIVFRR